MQGRGMRRTEMRFLSMHSTSGGATLPDQSLPAANRSLCMSVQAKWPQPDNPCNCQCDLNLSRQCDSGRSLFLRREELHDHVSVWLWVCHCQTVRSQEMLGLGVTSEYDHGKALNLTPQCREIAVCSTARAQHPACAADFVEQDLIVRIPDEF